ncbi:shikimate 5-dehydrogenase [uncultured Roseburia sp.]|uniref:Shikimate dehydrogenase n=1 Tax=Brotonthovivens ammoniilytica TaxID=2981725 RepID=A0ABT2TKP9_9FIRM|nr:shikimate dehydrogenase [Brotonthovivens ammoniilytica]MCU6762783.1 shikimate dehydrogenase [Brotonthovivens ammoniilytica]SCI88735.1 shikimate 5-dehydrogenase [uncultured Roseburia sp.]
MNSYVTAVQPTIYFIGVTTTQSSIMRVFPEWAKALGLKDAVIKGIDFKPHSSPEEYREAVEFIKNDPLSLGALVTTHKIDLYHACKDQFEYLDSYAVSLGEISSISKKDGKLCGHAKDPISSGLALENFVPADYWKTYDGDVLLLGAGGSSLAMSMYLTQEKFGDNVPGRIIIANRSVPRLESAKELLKDLNPATKMEYIHNPSPADNDKTLASLKPHSLIVNATGLGKDAPGSPLTDDCQFPKDSLVWEINYRGNLVFKDQADAQKRDKRLHVEDGWIYFIHGWTQVISEVFHLPIEGEILNELSEIAKKVQSQK